MKIFVTFLALVVSSNGFIAKRNVPCCFHLSTTGAVTGTVGQLDDGLLREGGPLSQSQFCISNGVVVDSQGRGCIVTPPTNVIQCDTGATGSSPFSIACDGTVSFQGSSVFFECQTGDSGEANIYAGSPGGINCGQITLHADACMAGCPTTPPPPPVVPTCTASPPTTVTVTSTVTVTTCPAAPSCPGTLSANFEFPHLIIPIDSSNPNTAAGTSFFGTVSSTISSIFNFDIPASDSGKTCTLVFMLPTQAQLVTSSFTLSGSGAIDFSKLNAVATQGTTFANAPGVAVDYGVTTVSPGNSYTITQFACPAGTAISFEMKSSGGTSLNFFQDFNPCPIGLFINVS